VLYYVIRVIEIKEDVIAQMELVGQSDLLSQFPNIDGGENEEEGGEEGK
jgi:hypothetical protein